MMEIEFSPEADDEWAQILERDRKLAEVVDSVLDNIESGDVPGQMFQNHARFATMRVSGRDDLYAVVWEVREHLIYILRVGRVNL